VPTGDDGVYCMIAARPRSRFCRPWPRMRRDCGLGQLRIEWLRAGGEAEPTGATPIYKLVDKPVINVPGCRPLPT